MAESETKLPVKTGEKGAKQPWALQGWHPFETLRREIDRVFEDFDQGFHLSSLRRSMFDTEPFWRREWALASAPAVDIAETDKSYEITAELPGLTEQDIEVKLANGGLTIKGEKQEEKEEKEKGYFLHERRFGAFERAFRLPDGVDVNKIEATFKNGVLTVTLPKTMEAQTEAKKIEVKSA
ncbi:Hsp20/alpha crystallin family protein [Ralstonia solanacearum]|uniref:Hsp20/alpha crystallin family protein n=1 Tax=Ralstonia solanacearum TaxID=305 RepID=A0AAW5ZK21_RALSL|nr:Hsp20/alpha crystallin family protein [Ralstonia solanacearum]MDB0569963.1 Hsp20/alpha crystallin family protein [Ralstonia solanacearum]